MRRWSVWAASAVGAVGAGAGLAVARRRRPPAPAAATPAPPVAEAPAAVAAESHDDAATVAGADDAQAALDAARARLRERADRLRRDIEASGDGSPGGG